MWVRERTLAVGILPNALPVTRLGLRVKRGIAGAVARNRAKRIFREAYRRDKERLAPGWDIVAVLTKASGLSVESLEREWILACTKLKILAATQSS